MSCNDETELIGKKTNDCGDKDNVSGEKKNSGEWTGTELVGKEPAGGGETSGGKETNDGSSGSGGDGDEVSGNASKELSRVQVFTAGSIALGKSVLLVAVGTADDKLGNWDESTLL